VLLERRQQRRHRFDWKCSQADVERLALVRLDPKRGDALRRGAIDRRLDIRPLDVGEREGAMAPQGPMADALRPDRESGVGEVEIGRASCRERV